MIRTLREILAAELHSSFLQLDPSLATLSVENIMESLVAPPQAQLGDLAFGCFQIAKQLRTAPMQIANNLAQKISSQTNLPFSAQAAGPYLNLQVQMEFLARTQIEAIEQEHLFQPNQKSLKKRVMIEYSQPNTHKELHVGHMRNACLGLALSRIKKAFGDQVITSTFPGDVGTHVAKCLWYLKTHNQEPEPATNKGEWLGKMYSRGHLLLETLEAEQLAEAQKVLSEILKQLEQKSGPYFELWKKTREWSIELMSTTYDWLDIKFDHWYWESDVDSPSVKTVKDLFVSGKLIESQGAIGMDLSDLNLGFCLLLKKDGTGLYATKDLELARRKFEDYKIDSSIYVVDLRQALHFQQVFAAAERLGFATASKCYHLAYNFVELPDGAMSSRKGNIVPISELIQKMEQTLLDGHLAKVRGEWSEDERQKVAKQVANAAIKYGMVRIDTPKKIVFQMQDWLKTEGESGPFIQYSAARIKSLLRKYPLKAETDQNFNWSLLSHPTERVLLQKSLHYETVIANCASQNRVTPLCTWLFELAQAFNSFYHEVSVGQAESSELQKVRLRLCSAVGKMLERGLYLLGIEVPDRM